MNRIMTDHPQSHEDLVENDNDENWYFLRSLFLWAGKNKFNGSSSIIDPFVEFSTNDLDGQTEWVDFIQFLICFYTEEDHGELFWSQQQPLYHFSRLSCRPTALVQYTVS